MAVVQMRISELLLREHLLRLGDLDAEIIEARVDRSNGSAIVLTLDAPHLPDDVAEIDPCYTRSPGPDPVRLAGISHRHTDGHWTHPEHIGAPQ